MQQQLVSSTPVRSCGTRPRPCCHSELPGARVAVLGQGRVPVGGAQPATLATTRLTCPAYSAVTCAHLHETSQPPRRARLCHAV